MPDYTGRQFGNYSITRLLGEGGFAQVYLGEHVYLHTQVAIKVLLENLQEQDLQNFLHESRIVASLKHPSIVRVLDFGIAHEHIPFLVMAYAPHGTLRQRHAENAIVPTNTIVSYVQQVAAALYHAHKQRLIHRDVKPENMLLGSNNEVLLSDFGIAVLAHSTKSQSKEVTAGTLAYMAPEQLQGRPRPASDQYALAVATYEWFCGSKPFVGSAFYKLASQHLYAPVPSLREHIASIPDAIDAVVMRALAKTPEERFPSVVEFATALEHACMSASWFGASSRPSLAPSLNRAQATPAEAVLEAEDSAKISYTTSPAISTKTYTTVPFPGELEAVPGSSAHRGISRRTATLALAGIFGFGAVGGITWFTRNTRSSPSSAASKAVSTAQSSVSLPNQPVGTTLATYQHHSDVITGVTWSPDGRWIASSSYDTTVQVWSPVPRTPSFIYRGHSDKVLAVRWSPNGRFVASSGLDTTVQVWNAPSSGKKAGSELVIYRGHTTKVVGLAWSPDSQRIASIDGVSGETPMMHVWDAESGKHVMVYADPTQSGPSSTQEPYGAVAWSPNKQSIVTSIVTVSVWNVASSGRIIHNDHVATATHGLAWSPDSQRIASANDNKTVQIWDAKTTDTFFTYSGHTDAVNAVAWSLDGKYLASASSDTTVQVWDARQGKTLFTYKGHSAPVRALAWSADGRHLVSGGDDRKVLVWQAI